MANKDKTDTTWANILKEHQDKVTEIEQGKTYEITAEEIKRFREPRLMTKHDTSENVPVEGI